MNFSEYERGQEARIMREYEDEFEKSQEEEEDEDDEENYKKI